MKTIRRTTVRTKPLRDEQAPRLRSISRRFKEATASKSNRQNTERQRLSPLLRRRQLIEEAFAYFAEVGLGGSTRELAKRTGMTQPLLYRYFATKSSLIEAVYDVVYVNRWRPEWTRTLTDRTIRLQDRLKLFYKSYFENALTREWLRIYLFAGLIHPSAK
jgi:AcrR family transcriptional regulator